MQQCKFVNGRSNDKEIEEKVNTLLKDGYKIFSVLQQENNGTHICIVLLKDE